MQTWLEGIGLHPNNLPTNLDQLKNLQERSSNGLGYLSFCDVCSERATWPTVRFGDIFGWFLFWFFECITDSGLTIWLVGRLVGFCLGRLDVNQRQV